MQTTRLVLPRALPVSGYSSSDRSIQAVCS